MSFLPSGVIDNYIQRVTELSQSTNRIPTNDELEKIAADLEIGPEEIQLTQKQSQDHYVRDQGYSRLKYWDDAIEELQEAIALLLSKIKTINAMSPRIRGFTGINNPKLKSGSYPIDIPKSLSSILKTKDEHD